MKYTRFKKRPGKQSHLQARRGPRENCTLSYPIDLTPHSNSTLFVTFADVPEATSVGDNEANAIVQALDALEAAVEIYFAEMRMIPLSSRATRGQCVVTLPALVTSKVLFANEMLRQG
ncbi:hypothetical protein LFL96_11020 [Paraburkholderia sp. D15]|uniref:type II toxin-antitoxin system HicB family antitoxin n=1 Tax=Paraburkholderia sp. D15 TaxID=2880218 RepID=UPI0024794878|nr:hypothetical protein [Paraburkholderia sp. D15]WGS48335.1 hypothetical protein LFL96_11020 [Paraburkholderia sp. D15]